MSGVSRRGFIRITVGAVGGLLLCLHLDEPPAVAEAPVDYPPAAFVHVQPDGAIVIQVNRLELGQGVQTSLPMLLADEMDADWSHVVARLAPAKDVYRDPMVKVQMVGGSSSVVNSFQQYRELGARARAMLVAAAAQQWKVGPDQCRTKDSVVFGPRGQSAGYAQLAEAAASMPVPATVRLKQAEQLRLVGRRVPRLDSRAKCDGTLRYGLDLILPAMKVAVVAHPPVFGGRVRRLDDSEARRVEGVVDVFEIPLLRGSGVAVVADKFWAARQGRDRLRIDWDVNGIELADTAALWKQYREISESEGHVAETRGNAERSTQIQAEYTFPYLAHAPMEPLNTTVRFDGDRAEVWAGSQLQTFDQKAVAEVLGLQPEQVTLHTEMAGGSFGRRLVPDSHVQREAATIAKRLRGLPVKLIWPREDDVQGGYYRPMVLHRVQVGLDHSAMPLVWRHHVVGQSLLAASESSVLDHMLVDGAAHTRYDIPNFHVVAHHPKVNVPVLWWRSVGHTHTAFVMETMMDELASRAQIDPFVYRRKLITADARKLRAALDLLDEKTAAWRGRVAPGHGVGISCHESFGTGVACAAEVWVDNGRLRIERVTMAVDAGLAVNPLGIESQFQAGATFGLTQLVPNGAITLQDGRVQQSNFDGFTPPYMVDAPRSVEVHIVASTEAPSGCGEPPVPVISPAVANALAQVTGKRIRNLPLRADDLRV